VNGFPNTGLAPFAEVEQAADHFSFRTKGRVALQNNGLEKLGHIYVPWRSGSVEE